jgi:hypothetical protein
MKLYTVYCPLCEYGPHLEKNENCPACKATYQEILKWWAKWEPKTIVCEVFHKEP